MQQLVSNLLNAGASTEIETLWGHRWTTWLLTVCLGCSAAEPSRAYMPCCHGHHQYKSTMLKRRVDRLEHTVQGTHVTVICLNSYFFGCPSRDPRRQTPQLICSLHNLCHSLCEFSRAMPSFAVPCGSLGSRQSLLLPSTRHDATITGGKLAQKYPGNTKLLITAQHLD
jgi:hypothetical protein